MKSLTLHPLSINLVLNFARPVSMEELKRLLGGLFEGIGKAISRDKSCVIGHIKGLATLEHGYWLKVNLVAADRPAQAESSSDQPVAQACMAVNLMVYGIEPPELFKMAKAVINQPDKPWSGLISLANPDHPQASGHHHQTGLDTCGPEPNSGRKNR